MVSVSLEERVRERRDLLQVMLASRELVGSI